MRTKTKQEFKDHIRRSVVFWLDETLSLQKDHHFALMTETELCYVSVNFTCKSLPSPKESNITKQEAAELVYSLSRKQIESDDFDFILQCISDKSDTSLTLFKFNSSLFIFSNSVTVIIAEENNKPYEATLSGASIH